MTVWALARTRGANKQAASSLAFLLAAQQCPSQLQQAAIPWQQQHLKTGAGMCGSSRVRCPTITCTVAMQYLKAGAGTCMWDSSMARYQVFAA